ncbi:T9SS type B sorting domain-containing protein [Empedobacter brevis]|uniref:T9SS type B sorting domain-containing protein n=1 Tax=Empedobacter brevis TaxID=247 RepID=UPI0023F11576|nr:T9SS type B sorting domain-containing protein [Empedobacter brevis]
MQKIFYFFLLMISGFVWGQRPIIHQLLGGFTFENQTLDFYPSNINFTPIATDGCSFNPTQTYKYFSFKANFDMVFAFDLQAKVPDFKFLTWKLTEDQNADEVFVGNSTTIKASRSVEGSSTLKGMKEGDPNSCETYLTSGANGYAKAFEGSEILRKGETVIIAVYGGSTTEPFDIKVNVAEEKSITTFNNLCKGQAYTYQQIFDAVQADSGLADIKLFTDNTFSTEVAAGMNFTSYTIIYAQVRDASGNLKYIYTIPLKFVPEHQFNFNSTINQVFECTLNYTLKENTLLNLLFPSGTNLSNYKIKTVNGTAFVENSIINLTTGSITDLKIIVSYNGMCPIDSVEKIIQVKQGTPEIKQNIDDATCDPFYKIDFDQIFTKIGFSKNDFDLIVTLMGTPISNGQSTPITTTLDYKVKVKSKYGGACESNEVDFIVTKTSPANITNTSINGICLSDFSQTDVDNAIHIIQNAHSYKLRFYQADGLTEMAEADLFNYIKTNETGKIVVKALATDNSNTICDTQVELKFNLDQSSFALINNIPTLNSGCAEVGMGYTFTIAEIENYLKAQLGRADISFSGITEQVLADNGTTSLRFQVQVNGEACWSEEMELKLQVITKPKVSNASKDLYADCDDKITINGDTVKELFGVASVTDYNYYILHNSSTPLVFVGGKAIVKVRFENKLSSMCFVEKDIVVIEKQDLVVDVVALETYNQTNEIVYCEDDNTGAKAQIQANLDYIKSHYPTLVSRSSIDEIFDQFNSDKGNVEIVFEDPNYCGVVSIKFFYQRNDLPIFDIPASGEICSDTKYTLDFEQVAKEKGIDVNDYTFAITGSEVDQVSAFVYELGVGNYTITIRDKKSGCPKIFSLQLISSAVPTIDKITINEKSIVVSVKGNGKLEYALFDSVGRIIVDWQTKNELIIPDNITDNNFTVKVRLNNCGVSERKDVIYLFLPNVVTPNQDGKNDVWQPMTKNGKVNDTSNSYKLIIFDRSGKQILNKEGIDIIKWDGTLNGNPVADGTYWYMLEFSKQSDDLKVLYSGSILVKRKIK